MLRGVLAAAVASLVAACAPSKPTSRPAASRSSAPSGSPKSAPPAAPSPTVEPTAGPPIEPSPSSGPGLATKIAGLIVVGFRGIRLGDAPWIATALADPGIGGVILFNRDQESGGRRNIASPAQVARLTADLRLTAGDRELIIAVDQEGGLVTRLSEGDGFPALASEAQIGRGAASVARRWGRTIASTLADAGIGLNLAPVVDLDVNPASPAIGALDRSFSADPDVVVKMAGIEIRAHRGAGVRTTLKHFPGIGSSTGNTDDGVVDVTDTWTRRELAPFRQLIAAGLADVVMAAHVINRKLDPDRPTSLSPAVVTDLLRRELGWDGVVITDDLQAKAITDAFGAAEASVLALEAGNDLLLFANQQSYDEGIVDLVVEAVTAAVASGRIDVTRIDEAWARVQAMFGGTVT